jgi:hypothetical protein
MTNEVAKLRTAEIQPAQPASVTAIPNVVASVMEGLKQAVTEMKADDISLELSASQEGQRSNARFSLRAYRNGRKVIDESRDLKEKPDAA